MSLENFIRTLDAWSEQQIPFFFLVDFEMQKPLAWKANDVPADIKFSLPSLSHQPSSIPRAVPITLKKSPSSLESFREKFDVVYDALRRGDSYLVNLTLRTPVEVNTSLDELYDIAQAKYKLLWRDKLLVFSPETFVQVRDGRIATFPMKGTIDAARVNAAQLLLDDPKELAEHVTIVDLLRNDLSLVAEEVKVTRFRYLEQITAGATTLYQTSSEISGTLLPRYRRAMGSMLAKLLPAGSISGAPKPKTCEIISEAEGETRGYYTGVFGYFDGQNLDSAVMIRFLENQNGNYFYRSGGGITAQSNCEQEYQEMLEKIYVPVH